MKCYTFLYEKLLPGIQVSRWMLRGKSEPRSGIRLLDRRKSVNMDYYNPPLIDRGGLMRNVGLRKIHRGSSSFDVLSKSSKEDSDVLLRLTLRSGGKFTNYRIYSGAEIICRAQSSRRDDWSEDLILRLSEGAVVALMGPQTDAVYILIKDACPHLKSSEEVGEVRIADVLSRYKRVYWLARHALTEEQRQKIRDLHGSVDVIMADVVFNTNGNSLAKNIEQRCDGFVYAVAPAGQILEAISKKLNFGYFDMVNDQGKITLKKTFHSLDGDIVSS